MEKVYPDELMEYKKAITKRRNGNYLMLLNIISAPHAEEEFREQLIDDLMGRDRMEEKLDKVGMMMLMQKMSQPGSKIKVAGKS